MLSREEMLELSRRADGLTSRYPPGTACRYWTGAREGAGVPSRLRSAWAVLPSGEVVVWVEGHPACIAASHVECEPRMVPCEWWCVVEG